MKVYGCQFDIAWEDKAANFERVLALLATARPEAGSLVALPEMFSTGFSMRVPEIAETERQETAAFLSSLARAYQVFVIGGLVTQNEGGRGRNEAAVFSPGGQEIARYHKMHPFSFGGETRYYESGERPILFSWDDFTVAPFICYDLRFPEVFRTAVRGGAELMVVIANWPQPRESHWTTLLRARAIENQAYVIGVNRCGHDPKLTYSGRTMIVDPRGEALADAGSQETVLSADLNLSSLQEYRRQFPALQDMHPEYSFSVF
jgi:predicted amidohydrolase